MERSKKEEVESPILSLKKNVGISWRVCFFFPIYIVKKKNILSEKSICIVQYPLFSINEIIFSIDKKKKENVFS
jgi:hypothetical protein